MELVSTRDNVVMTRTLSKGHGLAAVRVGWLYGPAHVVDAINRVRGPFNVNASAIAAAAASMRDRKHLEAAVDHNNGWLPKLTDALEGIGLKVTPSVGNFVLIHFPETGGKSAADADEFLLARGFVLRRVSAYGLPNALRMSIGTDDANEGLVEALSSFMVQRG